MTESLQIIVSACPELLSRFEHNQKTFHIFFPRFDTLQMNVCMETFPLHVP